MKTTQRLKWTAIAAALLTAGFAQSNAATTSQLQTMNFNLTLFESTNNANSGVNGTGTAGSTSGNGVSGNSTVSNSNSNNVSTANRSIVLTNANTTVTPAASAGFNTTSNSASANASGTALSGTNMLSAPNSTTNNTATNNTASTRSNVSGNTSAGTASSSSNNSSSRNNNGISKIRVTTKDIITALGAATSNNFSSGAKLVFVRNGSGINNGGTFGTNSGMSTVEVIDGNSVVDVSDSFAWSVDSLVGDTNSLFSSTGTGTGVSSGNGSPVYGILHLIVGPNAAASLATNGVSTTANNGTAGSTQFSSTTSNASNSTNLLANNSTKMVGTNSLVTPNARVGMTNGTTNNTTASAGTGPTTANATTGISTSSSSSLTSTNGGGLTLDLKGLVRITPTSSGAETINATVVGTGTDINGNPAVADGTFRLNNPRTAVVNAF